MTLFLMAAAVSVLCAEVLIGRFRLYRFGVEEACAVGAAVLVAAGSALVASPWTVATSSDRQVFIALLAGSAAAFAVYRRYGYVYAAVGALLCVSLAPFHLPLSNTVQRLLAAALLGGCFIGARIKRRKYGDEFPGDEHATIQASAWLGLYAALNLHLFPRSVARQPVALFYWFTYAMIWILPAAGLRLSIRDRDRPMLAASLVMGLATLSTNKPYLGAAREPWDPILLGLLLIGTAIVMRRWLADRQGWDPGRLHTSASPAFRQRHARGGGYRVGGRSRDLCAPSFRSACARALQRRRWTLGRSGSWRLVLVSRLGSSLSHRGRRGARPARREEGEYREYLTDEPRRGTGCIGGRMQTNFRDTTLLSSWPGREPEIDLQEPHDFLDPHQQAVRPADPLR